MRRSFMETMTDEEMKIAMVEAMLDGACTECASPERRLEALHHVRISSSGDCYDAWDSWDVWECEQCGTLYCL